MNTALQQRFAVKNPLGMADELQVVCGDVNDYLSLAEHHYRARRPATMTRIFALRHCKPTVVGRYLQRDEQSRTVGVLVESIPAMRCKLRDMATGGRYGRLRDIGQRAAVLGKELRCISRVVVHPQWRGLGLAVRLVRASLAEPVCMFTESLAAMGHVHPFFELAGMTAYRRQRHEFDSRLVDAMRLVGIEVDDLGAIDAVTQRISDLPDTKREWLHIEFRRWLCRWRQTNRGVDRSLVNVLRAAQRRLACQPVYYLHDNRKGQ